VDEIFVAILAGVYSKEAGQLEAVEWSEKNTQILKLEPSYGKATNSCFLTWALIKIEKCFKKFNAFHCPKEANVTQNQDNS